MPAPKAVQAPLDALLLAPRPQIVIRNDGVGPIVATTTRQDLARLLPELEHDGELRWDPETSRELEQTWFSIGGQHVLTVFMEPTASRPLVRVRVSDPTVMTEAGAHAGQRVSDLVRIYPDLGCVFDKKVVRGQQVETTLLGLSCTTPRLPKVTFALAAREDRQPGPVAVDALAGETVQLIEWQR